MSPSPKSPAQSEEPLSPAETKMDVPSAAAVWNADLKATFDGSTLKASQTPKLWLTMDGGLSEAVRFSRARSPPNVVVSAQTASTIEAFGAIALAISPSRSASPSAPLAPGSVHAFEPAGWVVVTVPVNLLRNSLR